MNPHQFYGVYGYGMSNSQQFLPAEQNDQFLSAEQNYKPLTFEQNHQPLPVDQNHRLLPIDQNHEFHPIQQNDQLLPVDQNHRLLPIDQNHGFHPIQQNDQLLPVEQNDQPLPAEDAGSPELDGLVPMSAEEIEEALRVWKKESFEKSLTFTGEYQGQVKDLESAERLLSDFATINNRQGKAKPRGTNDCPTDPAKIAELNRQLFTAIKDCSSGLGATRRSRNGEGVQESIHVKRVKALPDSIVEALGLKIIDAISKTQSSDVGLHDYGPSWGYDEFDTFQDRFDAVKEYLMNHKSAVNDLLRHDPVMKLCAAPLKERGTKSSNLELNRKRSLKHSVVTEAINKNLVVMPEVPVDERIAEEKGQVRQAKRTKRERVEGIEE
ncbi:hypothetical protein QBC41DRAFT_340408 [Cercophora samala]|uniref:Uncharacterized protein n=1 Tax=Cercophora samala TaxID=330535 RepID=A0AA39Z4B3_9PEZI|nr:hypothetical protein QBC41DRAFT_340408 [Cercophora samala]